MNITVGIGDMAVSQNPSDQIWTYALGSCVAVTVYVPSRQVAGLIHIALPRPLDRSEELSRAAYFASSGIPRLIQQVLKTGQCLHRDLQVQLFGGADSLWGDDLFNIGRKNIEATQAALAELGLVSIHSELGGVCSRTITLEVATGAVQVKTLPWEIQEGYAG